MVSADKSGRRGCERITSKADSWRPAKSRTRADIGDPICEFVLEGQEHDHEPLSSDRGPDHRRYVVGMPSAVVLSQGQALRGNGPSALQDILPQA
jgi:hypothetical protein